MYIYIWINVYIYIYIERERDVHIHITIGMVAPAAAEGSDPAVKTPEHGFFDARDFLDFPQLSIIVFDLFAQGARRRHEAKFVGWANNNFDNLHVRKSLETKKYT